MSIDAIARAYTIDATPQERNVLFALALFADENLECWPGLDTIAEMAQMARVPTIRAINKLEKAGIVERIEKGHRGQSTRYVLIGLKGIQFDEKSIRKYTLSKKRVYRMIPNRWENSGSGWTPSRQ